MSERYLHCIIVCCTLLLSSTRAFSVPADVADALRWRLVGPMRAGWGTAVTGVIDQPDTYYFGGAAGGVWKTQDAGLTWRPVFDDGPASIGAIASAPSDGRVLYVGTGQITTRYDVAAGAGLFRSGDGGASWQPRGLAATRHIGEILVDPKDPDTLLVAALGHVFGPNPERGVFRSEDGGRSWQHTLFVSENTGAVDLAADPQDSQQVFAAVWQVRFRPWLSYFTPDVGPESGLYASHDGGRGWQRVSGKGLPAGPLGRIGLAAAHTAQGTRVYAVIDAEKDGGLYRSDDAGSSWQRVNDDAELVNGYFARLEVVPGDPDTVYVMGRSIHRCTAGGAQCDITKGSPGGDDYHDLWINPKHPDHMITGADQGTVITVDGGAHWSSWYNQPTGQVYHLATDNRVPYWIYAGQQDNGTLRIASRSDYGSITFRNWSPVGADERDYDIPDPVDPDIVYGSGLGGRLSRWNARNGEVQNISPWPVVSYGSRPTSVRYRYTWITPIAMSRLPPYPLYQGAQLLFRSEDRGAHWQSVSPDLSAHKAGTKGCDGDLAPAKARDCGYGVIFSIALSPRDNDEIWIGTDDGLVQMTRDAGATWVNVTPRGVPPWAKIVTVDLGPTPGSAYIAVDNHRQDDFSPRAFATRDYGATWTAITNGLPAQQYVTVVRADPARDGLLYAGTDRGVFVSFDDGAEWRPLQLNLPSLIVTDLLVHDRDLIVGSMGRAIWVLDDVTPLRQANAIARDAGALLFAPAPALRIRANQNRDTPLPPEEPAAPNPPIGAYIDYWLARDAATPIAIEIRDARGGLVRRFASDDKPTDLGAERYFAEGWLHPAPPLSASAGAHRLVWDLRYPRPRSPAYEYNIGTAWGMDTPIVPQGALVPPGQYRVILRVDGKDYEQPLSVRPDPRVNFDAASAELAMQLMQDVQGSLASVTDTTRQVTYLSAQLDASEQSLPGMDRAGRSAIAALRKRVELLTAGEPSDSTKLADIGEVLKTLEVDLEASDAAPTQPQHEVLVASNARLERATALWREIQDKDLPRLNAVLGRGGLAPIAIPPAEQLPPARSSPGKEMP
jgi:photosystem II stability/assembly factor-like uncharacterized protein